MSSSLVAPLLLRFFLGPTLYEAVEPHMGTLFRIKLYADDEKMAQAAFRAAFSRVSELDRILSDYNPESELNVSVKAAGIGPVAISADLATVLSASQKMSAETDGAFDVTVGPLTRLWRAARRDNQMPATAAIGEALEKCGFRKVHLEAQRARLRAAKGKRYTSALSAGRLIPRPSCACSSNETSRMLRVDRKDMQLDLGAIAKGYAADEALAVISRMGIRSALVAASGDLAFSDAPPGQAGWKIGIDSLDRADRPFTRVLFLRNAAVSTSGGTEQFLRAGGKRFSHIIDPKTGMGLTEEIAVTTIARRGITTDAAATAISVLGCRKGLAFTEAQPDLAALILEQKEGRSKVTESSRFKNLVNKYSASAKGAAARRQGKKEHISPFRRRA